MLSNKAIMGAMVVALVCFVGCVSKKQVRTTEHATIAVWDLDNLSPTTDSGQPDLGAVLAGKVMETIKASGKRTVVERQQLLIALEELNLATSSLVDDDTRLNLGNMVGARFMVFGAYQVIGDTMRLDLRLVEVETGTIVKAASQLSSGGNLSSWLKAAEAAAKDL
jgi:curli biogenesis system outer membrane secretion channel CsgG